MRPIAIAVLLLLAPLKSYSLNTEQFAQACQAYAGDCANSPFLQAYIGGALDLVAMLDEETAYLDKIYCREPSEFFDAPTIIRYVMEHKKGNGGRNVMLLVIRYLEEKGVC